jgi:ABC-type sugar transport system substrate-binding protein
MPRHIVFSPISIAIVSIFLGCDSTQFLPPPPAELNDAPVPETSTAAKNTPSSEAAKTRMNPASEPGAAAIKGIELILPRPITLEREKLVHVLRSDAGRRKLVFRLEAPKSGDAMTSDQMVQAIRKAAERKCAIVVEPIDSPAVCEALRDAQKRGSVVLSFDSSMECLRDPPPVHSIEFTGFSERAKELVTIAVAEAETRHFAADRPIVVLENLATYSYGKARLESLEGALRASKLPFDTVRFEGDHNQAQAAMKTYLETHPKPRIVLAHDHEALAAGFELLQAAQRKNASEFVVAGYAMYDVREGFSLVDDVVACIVQDVDAFSRTVVRTIHELADGKKVRDRTELNLELVRLRK